MVNHSSGGTLVVAWTHASRRQELLAEEIGSRLLVAGGQRDKVSPVRRYCLASVLTVREIWRQRPSVVIITLPPIVAGLLVYVVSRIFGFEIVLDSHPGAFGLMGDRASTVLQPLHRFLLRRARYVAVTTDALVGTVRELGGCGGTLHEPPSGAKQIQDFSSPFSVGGDYVMFPGSGGRDEPYEVIFQSAYILPGTSFVATGSPAKPFSGIPTNVRMTGWLGSDDFEVLIGRARVVVVLSTEDQSVMRTAYEASYAGRPLVVTDTTATREFFPFAVHVSNDGESVANGIEIARSLDPAVLDSQREFSTAIWRRQLDQLLEHLS